MQHITYELVQKSVNSIVLVAMIITFLPFAGFGAYIDDSNPEQLKCIRYRDAAGMLNRAYSIFFMIFGKQREKSFPLFACCIPFFGSPSLQAACWCWS